MANGKEYFGYKLKYDAKIFAKMSEFVTPGC
jgi:hypothetical protein